MLHEPGALLETEAVVAQSGFSDPPESVIQQVAWPVAAEVRVKQNLGVYWNMPSASQAGDNQLIEEDLQDERDRRGQSRLQVPPMDSLRETLLLEKLWKLLLQRPTPDPKPRPLELVELILMLTVYCEYELIVLHLQHEERVGAVHEEVEDLERAFYEFSREGNHAAEYPGGKAMPEQQLRKTIAHATTHAPMTKNSILEDGEIGPAISTKRRRLSAPSTVSSYMERSRVPSTIQSSVFKDPHEGCKLKAFRSRDFAQTNSLASMFDAAHERIEVYKTFAREDLLKIHGLVWTSEDGDMLSDLSLARLVEACRTNSGASAALKLIQWTLLEDEGVQLGTLDPLTRVTDTMLSLLLKICVIHPRKRVSVIRLVYHLLLPSFRCAVPVTPAVVRTRHDLIQMLIVYMCLANDEPPANNDGRLPWRARCDDWELACPVTTGLVCEAFLRLQEFFDSELTRSVIDTLAHVCLPPYSTEFANFLCPLLLALLTGLDTRNKINAPVRNNAKQLRSRIIDSHAPYPPTQYITLHCDRIKTLVAN